MPNAFVLMPFGGDFDAVFDGLIKVALTNAGFTVTRADLSINQTQILRDIVLSLTEADLVIVDVTGLNGNVMYELGLAHAMGRRTVMITRDIDELPFDLRAYRATEYSTNFAEAPLLIERLSSIAAGVVDGTADFSNPVQDFAPDFVGANNQVASAPAPIKQPSAPLETGERSEEIPQETESLGLLDYAVELNEATEQMIATAQEIGDATTKIGDRADSHGEQLRRAQSTLGDKAAPTLRAIMRGAAKDFDEFSDELDRLNPQLYDIISEVAKNANGLARLRDNATDDERAQIESDIQSMREAEEAFEDSYTSVSTFASTLSELPAMERTMNLATTRAARTVTKTAETIKSGQAEFARVRGLLEERLNGGREKLEDG